MPACVFHMSNPLQLGHNRTKVYILKCINHLRHQRDASFWFLQASKDCVQKTVKRLEDKLQGKVLKQALYCMHSTDKMMQERTVTALARLAQAGDLQNIFIKRQGLDILMSLVTNHVADPDSQREAAGEAATPT